MKIKDIKQFKTLEDVLMTQDMGAENANKICRQVLDGEFDANKDPISAIIVNAFTQNDYINYDDMTTDFDYAINQLRKAQAAVEACVK